MKAKNYKQKRTDLKDEKRIGLKNHFENNQQRRKFVQGIKRQYRALKRSEKQVVKKQIEKEL
jgi:hypothetical protein